MGAIWKSDYLISGGGSLLQDATSVKSLIYYLFVIFIGLIFGKKVVIFAQGIGPIKNPFGRFLTSLLLKFCTYVSVRDEKSLKLLKTWGINCDLVCDPVFSLDMPHVQKEEAVAIQLRDFKTMNEDFIDRLAGKVAKEFPDKKIEIYAFQNNIDLDVCKRFERALNLLNSEIKTNVYSDLTDEEIISGIAKAKYLIAMRFHAIIVGLLTDTKTLAIDYDIKVQKLASEFDLPVIDLKDSFGNSFEDLKNIDITKIDKLVRGKNFDWSGFLKSIED
jgi:N-acetylglucosaminyldiphosphoundecaprenol N-acetyl-beta-D-mannosaminyltransferase